MPSESRSQWVACFRGVVLGFSSVLVLVRGPIYIGLSRLRRGMHRLLREPPGCTSARGRYATQPALFPILLLYSSVPFILRITMLHLISRPSHPRILRGFFTRQVRTRGSRASVLTPIAHWLCHYTVLCCRYIRGGVYLRFTPKLRKHFSVRLETSSTRIHEAVFT